MEEVIGLIAANYSSSGLGELTEERTIASLPFGGRYRLIDFPLSNMVNAGLNTVGVVTPYKYRSIIDHIGAGKAWSLDRKNGGLFVLPGSVFGISNSSSRFLLRDISRNRVYLLRSPAPYVLVSGANIVCNMDCRKLIEAHLKSGADITLTYKTAAEDNPFLTGLRVEGGRVVGMTRGVRRGEPAFLDCFMISRSLLLKIVEWYSAINYLDLFEVLEEDYDKMDVGLCEFTGYAAAVFDTQSYFRHNMELLDPAVYDEVFSGERPVMTKVQDYAPAKYLDGARVANSLVSAGCVISGSVENSVLFRGVTVEKGAVVRNSIVMQNCVLQSGAQVDNAILDRNNVIPSGTVLKGTPEEALIKEKRADQP